MLFRSYVHEIGTKVHYLFHDSGWAEILKGFDLRFSAEVLISRGLMLPGDGGRRTRKQRIGAASPRFYTVSAEVLEWDDRSPIGMAQPDEGPSGPEPGSEWDSDSLGLDGGYDFDADPFGLPD